MKALGSVLAIVLMAATLPGAPAETKVTARHAWGAVAGGLRVGISPVGSGIHSSSDVQFDVAFENTGDSAFFVNLGLMLGNGKSMFPTSLGLVLTDPTAHTRELDFLMPIVSGRVDDFIVPLRKSSMYGLRVSLNQYWSPATKEFRLKLAAGKYRIAARFEGKGAAFVNRDMQGLTLVNVWKGSLQSNVIDFKVSTPVSSR